MFQWESPRQVHKQDSLKKIQEKAVIPESRGRLQSQLEQVEMFQCQARYNEAIQGTFSTPGTIPGNRGTSSFLEIGIFEPGEQQEKFLAVTGRMFLWRSQVYVKCLRNILQVLALSLGNWGRLLVPAGGKSRLGLFPESEGDVIFPRRDR